MSVNFNKAMGYGMPWGDFCRASPLNPNKDHDRIYDVFSGMTEQTMTVPREITKASLKSRPAILEQSLLSENFTSFGKNPASIVSGTNLFAIVDPIDEPSNIIFFPNANFARKWQRRSDDLDIVHEVYRSLDGRRGNSEEVRTYCTYVEYGHYPFTNDLMLKTGERVEWDYFETVEKNPQWLAAVPNELRWYLPEHNILKIEDVLRLRPLIAQWWS